MSALFQRLAARGAIVNEDSREVIGFDDLATEYAAVARGGGLQRLDRWGCLRVRGADAADLLERLVTNRVRGLPEGSGCRAFLTSPKGRIIGLLDLLRRREDLLLITREGQAAGVAATIEKYTVTDDVIVETMNDAVEILRVTGQAAGTLLETSTDAPLADIEPCSHGVWEITGRQATWIAYRESPWVPADAAGSKPSGDALANQLLAVVPREEAAEIWDEILAQGSGAGLVPMGSRVAEVLRIEAGVGGAERELSERYNPLEVGGGEAVCLEKGCYVGQEVIARLHAYDKVRRRLAGVDLGRHSDLAARLAQGQPAPLAPLVEGEREVGTLTSAAFSPRFEKTLGLAMVRIDQFEPGRRVEVFLDTGKQEAHLSEVPFEGPFEGPSHSTG